MKIYSSHKTIREQFETMDKIPIFEIPVTDIRTQDDEFLIFDISIQDGKFIARHVPLNKKEELSDKIAFCSVNIDMFFSLDENLQELYSERIESIIDSTFYELREE